MGFVLCKAFHVQNKNPPADPQFPDHVDTLDVERMTRTSPHPHQVGVLLPIGNSLPGKQAVTSAVKGYQWGNGRDDSRVNHHQSFGRSIEK